MSLQVTSDGKPNKKLFFRRDPYLVIPIPKNKLKMLWILNKV